MVIVPHFPGKQKRILRFNAKILSAEKNAAATVIQCPYYT